mgnify:CR=1 FL=1|tara:strand:- start:16132 stop:16695 length:564 start_codon:yes stop_codon:yes gene_type:complete
MKYLIIGLGNPGVNYQNTRHNIGFAMLDRLASLSNTSFTSDRYAAISEIAHKGRKLILVKPTTFMNLSGKAVRYWMQKSNVKQENILVITDDISLSFGALRLRAKGSHGGHNGLKDIQTVLASTTYSRLRFGIGKDYARGRQAEYVLSLFSDEENQTLEARINIGIQMVQAFTINGVDRTMSEFNRK